MSEIASAMAAQHAQCDSLFAAVLTMASQGSWGDAASEFKRFIHEIEVHMAGEDAVLFPAFESATGMRDGPTAVMRREHDRMRALFAQIERALAAHDTQSVEGYTSTLLIIMRQHNLKEENVLYAMLDAALHDRAEELIARLALGRK